MNIPSWEEFVDAVHSLRKKFNQTKFGDIVLEIENIVQNRLKEVRINV